MICELRRFVHVDGQNHGPYTGHEIKQMIEKGQVLESDFLCPEYGTAWTQARNEPLLGVSVLTRKRPKARLR